jgi:hypothetical protein
MLSLPYSNKPGEFKMPSKTLTLRLDDIETKALSEVTAYLNEKTASKAISALIRSYMADLKAHERLLDKVESLQQSILDHEERVEALRELAQTILDETR